MSDRRVCVVGPGLDFLSGVAVYTNQLTRALAGSEDVLASVILLRRLLPRRFYPGGARVGQPLSSLDYDGVNTYNGIDWFWGTSLLRALVILVRRRPSELLLQWWTAATAHTYVVLAVVARLRGVRVVVEYHEVQDTGEMRVPGVQIYGRWALRVLRLLSRGSIVHSAADAELLRSTVRGFGTSPLLTVPHPPYDHLRTVAPHRPQELVDDDEQCLRVLFFGLLRPYKGVDDLVRATERAVELGARLQVVIAGEPWEESQATMDRIEQSSASDHITLIPRYVRDDEAAFLFDWADVLALPYRRVSSSGPLALGMSAGLTIVHSDLPAFQNALGAYDRAIAFPPGRVGDLAEVLDRLAGQGRSDGRDEAPRSQDGWPGHARAVVAWLADLDAA